MAILPIIEVPDPRLRVISKPVAAVTDATRALIASMFETMYHAPGVGLAAIQVGVAERVVVIDLQRDGENGEPVSDPRVFINPEITETSEALASYNEGCLSVPEIYADVERPERIRATWLDAEGARRDEWIDGFMATALQHEMDHLNGVLFIDYLTKLKRDMLLKKLDKQRKVAA